MEALPGKVVLRSPQAAYIALLLRTWPPCGLLLRLRKVNSTKYQRTKSEPSTKAKMSQIESPVPCVQSSEHNLTDIRCSVTVSV
ncbi:unnamed protein product [Protopolystoma xenopodis]|uniref:Uncharacterized protein n=1 Tax=Protopolystoma xenopodis TaxID=117903 RepID=A0A3S5A1V8_9PLAT|nr:unnamed protein product [Protopolystoma xenopodis]